jgi:hypothetical protein
MNDLAWSDLDTDEQRAISMLAQGISPDFCDPVALLTLRRIGLVKGSRLTFASEQMLSSAVRIEFGETAKPQAESISV